MSVVGSGDVEFVDLATISPEPDAIRRIPRALALRHDVLSLFSDDNQLTVAVPDAHDREAIDRVRFATGMHVRVVGAHRAQIRARLNEAYGAAALDEAPAVRALDEIHERAIACKASDIHLEPDSTGGRVRHRVDGVLVRTRALPQALFSQTVSRVKLLAGMDIADKRQPQDGRYSFEAASARVHARTSSIPTVHGEKIVVRLLNYATRIPTLTELGMAAPQAERLRTVLDAHEGFIAATGPTGSGKTTTLYATLAERNGESSNVCSVEDPVEVLVPGVAQMQVNPRAGLTFGAALRALMRQDPDVIMVGETRDAETAAIAAGASLTGQLVLTTLHSIDALYAVERLLDLGIKRSALAAGLRAVVGQRLVRVLCKECRERTLPRARASELAIPGEAQAYCARGCAKCFGTGFAGRTAIFEVLFLTGDLSSAIAAGASTADLRILAVREGFEPMAADGLRKANAGETTFEELARVLGPQSSRE